MQEDQLEMDFEQQKRQEHLKSSQRKSYWARMNNTFLRAAGSSSNSIVGCYAPDGDHCEKPLEIGLKSNLAILSIFEENKENPTEGKLITQAIDDPLSYHGS